MLSIHELTARRRKTRQGMKKSLVDRAAERLANGIAGGAYPENRLPSQAVLQQQLGVSRTVIREAIGTLVARGMLDVQAGSGSRVTPTRRWKMFDGEMVMLRLLAQQREPAFMGDLMEFRALIEPVAAAQAALRADDIDRRVIRSCYRALLAANDPASVMAAAIEFHVAILMASGHQVLEQMADLLRALLATTYADGQRPVVQDDDGRAVLARLMTHMAARDASAVRTAMAELIELETDAGVDALSVGGL